MRYLGGKQRIAKDLRNVILGLTDNRGTYVEPFLGGGAVAEVMVPEFEHAFLSDVHLDLILMWDAAANAEWNPPDVVTEDEYHALRHAEATPLRGFVGMGGSFGGKWFGGYARGGFNSDGTPRNHQAESARSVRKTAERLRGATIYLADYMNLMPVPTTPVIYCDPPYAKTTTYSTGDFDSGAFWRKATWWAKRGYDVFVSEYCAPNGWICVWEKPLKVQAVRGDNVRGTNTERLFVYGDSAVGQRWLSRQEQMEEAA